MTYNIPFSRLWIYDRCQEFATIETLFVFGAGLLFLSILFQFWASRRLLKVFDLHPNQLVKLGVSFFITITTFLGLGFLALVALFGAFMGLYNYCSHAKNFWPPLKPIISLNGDLNHLHTFEQPLPTDQTSLEQQFPELTSKIKKNVKYTYTYEPETNNYTMIARPSKHSVLILGSDTPTAAFRLTRSSQLPSLDAYYPPSWDGPWENLPE